MNQFAQKNKPLKLDLGCGNRKKEGYVGVDIDPESKADVIASALNLPFEADTVDEVFSVHVLEHFSSHEAQKFFSEIFRVLKYGGVAYVRGDTAWTKKGLMKKDPTHKHRYSVKEIEAIVKPFGFSQSKVQKKIYRVGWWLRIFDQIFINLTK